MPANKEDEQALIQMYKELWGFNDADAKEEAATIMARGPSSDVYKSRMEMAQQHAYRQEDNQRREALTKTVQNLPSPDPAAAAQEALNQRRAALASPDPAAAQAQEALNQRRASLALAAPSPPLPTWSTADQPPQPPTNQPAPPPIAPTPLTPAAQTPQHLEDANLSSWQQFAQFLGYPIRRR